ncbi:MAG: hypothetical protein K2W88_05100, partial [Pararheinheimera sp.]|nr:hypothetical protein [Rheinheimera sp.]
QRYNGKQNGFDMHDVSVTLSAVRVFCNLIKLIIEVNWRQTKNLISCLIRATNALTKRLKQTKKSE